MNILYGKKLADGAVSGSTAAQRMLVGGSPAATGTNPVATKTAATSMSSTPTAPVVPTQPADPNNFWTGMEGYDPNKENYTPVAAAPKTSTTSITSEDAAGYEQRLKDKVAEEKAAQQSFLDDNMKIAEEGERARVSGKYDLMQTVLDDALRNEEATLDTAQIKMGQAGTDYEKDADRQLQDVQRLKILQLDEQRQQAMGQALNAVRNNNYQDAKRFEAQADAAFEEKMKVFNDYQKGKAEQLDMKLKQQTFDSNAAKNTRDDIERMAKSGIDLNQIAPEERSRYEQAAGLSQGSFDAYYQATYDTQNAKNQEDQVKAASSIITLLEKIPAGQTVKIGSAIYSGLQPLNDKSDVFQSTETDNTGNVTQIFTRLNPTTGKPEIVGSVALGKIGKGKTGDGSEAPAEVNTVLEAMSQNLLGNYKGSDNYVDTQKYREAYQEFAAKYPKHAAKFSDYLPPSAYLNPTDASAKTLFGVKP